SIRVRVPAAARASPPPRGFDPAPRPAAVRQRRQTRTDPQCSAARPLAKVVSSHTPRVIARKYDASGHAPRSIDQNAWEQNLAVTDVRWADPKAGANAL